MRKVLLKTTLAAAMAILVTGCGGGSDNIGSIGSYGGGDNGSTGVDSLKITKSSNSRDFVVKWNKNSGGYSEVIYTDDLNKKRGNGYTATSNSTGTITMVCQELYATAQEISYRCKANNVYYSKSVTLKAGVEYKWLVNYSDGVDFTKGEVQATMTYNDGELYIQ